MTDCIANGTISVVVPNLEAFTDAERKPKQITSTIEKIGGLAWQIKLRKLLNPTRLNMYVHCNEAVKDRLWMCKAQFTGEIWIKGTEDKLFDTRSFGHSHGFNEHYWLFPISKINLLEKKPMEIKLKIKIDTVLESFPPLDTSLVVNMGESRSETLFVNKYVLAGVSSYFRNLFFEDWRDKREQGGNMFELNEPEDFRIWAFKLMIYSAMTLGSMVHESKFLNYKLAYAFIKLAVKFDFSMLLDCCEKFLINTKKNSDQKMELLELADQFSLERLKENCLKEISVLDYTENLGKSTEMHLSKATRERLQEKLGGKAKELRKSAEELKTTSNRPDKSMPDMVNRSKKLTDELLG